MGPLDAICAADIRVAGWAIPIRLCHNVHESALPRLACSPQVGVIPMDRHHYRKDRPRKGSPTVACL